MKPTSIIKRVSLAVFACGIGVTVWGNVLLEMRSHGIDPLGLNVRSLGMVTMCGALGMFLLISFAERGAWDGWSILGCGTHDHVVLMNGPEYSDADVERLVRHNSRMTVLSLEGSQVTDVTLAYVERMTRLVHLNLRRTQVSDIGLTHLEGMATLRRIILEETRVSDRGVRLLQKMLPRCDIIR